MVSPSFPKTQAPPVRMGISQYLIRSLHAIGHASEEPHSCIPNKSPTPARMKLCKNTLNCKVTHRLHNQGSINLNEEQSIRPASTYQPISSTTAWHHLHPLPPLQLHGTCTGSDTPSGTALISSRPGRARRPG
jgi:hypothetical protein